MIMVGLVRLVGLIAEPLIVVGLIARVGLACMVELIVLFKNILYFVGADLGASDAIEALDHTRFLYSSLGVLTTKDGHAHTMVEPVDTGLRVIDFEQGFLLMPLLSPLEECIQTTSLQVAYC